MSDTAIIQIQNVTKRFGASVVAVDNVSLDIAKGEFFALLGPSGCGKTTLLRMVAGLESLSEGSILVDGKDMARIPANKRPINMVFQSYAVFPHMSVFENVAYGLKVAGASKAEVQTPVMEALSLVRLDGFENRRPDQLSGGQQQRVALARALVKKPKVLLLDEPLSALDAKLRAAMQLELVRLQETVGITFIIVTHDQNEALSMANRIAVMEDGLVRQIANPQELYEKPNSRFVADFIGSVNLFDGTITRISGDELLLECPALGTQIKTDRPFHGAKTDQVVSVALRPEKIYCRPGGKNGDHDVNCTSGAISGISYLGGHSVFEITTDSGAILSVVQQNVKLHEAGALQRGDRVTLDWAEDVAIVLSE